MNKAITFGTALMLLIGGGLVPAWAQQQQQQPSPQQQQRQQRLQQQQQQKQQPMAQQQQQRTIQGQITSITAVDLRGERRPHLIAWVRTQAGQNVPVNLGHRLDLTGVSFQTGQPVQISGRVGTINNRSVLFARNVTVDGQTFTVDGMQAQQRMARQARMRMQPQRQQMAMQQQQRKQLQGTIQDVRRVNIDQAGQHVLAKIQTTDGNTVVVDLGRPQNLQGLQIQQGAQIRVAGQPGRINDRPVLVADRLRADGQTISIQRMQEAQQAGQRQQQQQQQGY